jgi:hypothetical protein
VTDAAAESVLLEHARWLVDRQSDRLTSLESRAVAVVGWGSTQVALALGVLTLVGHIPGGWIRAWGTWFIAGASLLSVLAAVLATWLVLKAGRVPSPGVDLAPLRRQLQSEPSAADREKQTVDVLLGSIVDGSSDGKTTAVLPALKAVADSRGQGLRYATIALAAAVLCDGVGAVLLAIAITVKR